MALVGENHKHGPGNGADHRRQNHEQNFLGGLERRVITIHGVAVQEHKRAENQRRKRGVDEVSGPDFERRPVAGVDGGRPEPLGRGDGVVGLALGVGVAVGEAGEAAGEAADGDEGGGEPLVHGGALAVVGEDGVEELEYEDGAGGEEAYQVSDAGEGLFLNAFPRSHFIKTWNTSQIYQKK